MKAYHGPLPVTDSDLDMAKKHLKETLKLKKKELALNNMKILEHRAAAENADNPKSAEYNRGHIQGHVKDNKSIKKIINEREASMRTLKSVEPDRTSDDVRKSKVALMEKRT
jgi:hypothetical protein